MNRSSTEALIDEVRPETVIGTEWFVDYVAGNDRRSGKSWKNKSLKTIAAAQALCAAGDTIYIRGTGFNEAVAGDKEGVSYIGLGSGPIMASWTAPTVAASACLTLTAANCLVKNIRIRPVIYVTSGIPSGIKLSTGSSYTRIEKCLFMGRAGSYRAIHQPAAASGVIIADNEFAYMNTLTYGAAIKGDAAIACSRWQIVRNVFNSCLICIEIEGRSCLIQDNTFYEVGLAADNTFGSAVMTKGIDLTGTDTGANKVCGNHLGGVYSATLYIKGGTGDEWEGNWTRTVTATITNAAGMTLTATA